MESTRLSQPSHGGDPWDVPVPLEPADFTPLHAGHERYAVRVSLGRMGPFGFSAPDPEAGPLLHADLYRIGSPRELDELGLFDDPRAIVLIEWPERAPELAEQATMTITLTVPADGRGRVAEIAT